MTDTDKIFAGSVPEIYDTYLVPLIFEAFAADLAERVAALSPSSVLETAAGSGVVARALAPKLGSAVSYVATDLNQAMLDKAAAKQQAAPPPVWQQADALALPFDDASFDALCCQFGVMFFPDKAAGYAEARRVLRPNGRLIFSVWDRIEENEFAHLVTNTVAAAFPDDPPQFLARTPHGYHDLARIREELSQAGFSRVSSTTLEQTSHAPSPRHPAVAYCQGTPLRNEIEARDPQLLDDLTDRATRAIAERYGEKRVSAKIQGHVITAAP